MDRWMRWAALVIALILLYLVRGILAPFIIAAILAYLFSPLVDWLEQRLRVRRVLVIAVLYMVVFAVLGGVGFWIGPPLIEESRELGRQGPRLFEDLAVQLFGTERISAFGQTVEIRAVVVQSRDAVANALGNPSEALHLATLLVESSLKIFLCALVLFYFLLDGRRFGQFALRFVPAEHRATTRELAGRIHKVLGRYLRGQLLLIVLMSVVTYLCLSLIFGLRYALPIAIATGVLEIIPFVGPLIAAGIAASVGTVQSGIGAGIGILVLYLILRQVEDQLVMPLVVGRAVHLHPVATLFAALAGGALAGLLGIILAVPAAAAIKVVLDYTYPDPEARLAAATVAQTKPPAGRLSMPRWLKKTRTAKRA